MTLRGIRLKRRHRYHRELRVLSFQMRSNLPRRVDSADLLIARNSQSQATFTQQFSNLPDKFSETSREKKSIEMRESPLPLKCIKQLFIEKSFGIRISLQYENRTPSMTGCLSDRFSIDKKKPCRKQKVQDVQRMRLGHRWIAWSSTNLALCLSNSLPTR